METRAHHLLIGGFVLILALTAMAGVAWFAKGYNAPGWVYYDIYFQDSVAGMKQGAKVLFNGIEIGEVRELGVDTENKDGDQATQVEVAVRIDRKYQIRKDIEAVLTTQGLIGEVVVQFSSPMECRSNSSNGTDVGPGGCELSVVEYTSDIGVYDVSPDRRDERKIKAQRSPLQAFFNDAPLMLAKASQTLDHLNDILEQNSANFSKIVGNVAVVTAELADPEYLRRVKDDIATLVVGLEQTRAKIDTAITGFSGSMENNIDPAIAEFRGLVESLDRIVLENEGAITTFSNGTLPEVSQLIIDIRRMAVSLSILMERLENDPSGAIFAPNRPAYNPDNKNK